MSIKIGCDPEIFVRNENDCIVSVVGMLGGTKNNPLAIPKGALQEDNVMAEFNIDPATSSSEFEDNITGVLDIMNKVLKNNNLKYDTSFTTTHIFTNEELDSNQAKQFGCSPDMNIYLGRENELISPLLVGNTRMCGGHIHLGVDNPESDPRIRSLLVQWMDILVGVPLSVFDPDRTRIKFYGKAGNFRPKPYGVEYRTPSNFWVSNKNLRKFVFKNALLAATKAEDGTGFRVGEFQSIQRAVVASIEGKNTQEAKELMKYFNVLSPKM